MLIRFTQSACLFMGLALLALQMLGNLAIGVSERDAVVAESHQALQKLDAQVANLDQEVRRERLAQIRISTPARGEFRILPAVPGSTLAKADSGRTNPSTQTIVNSLCRMKQQFPLKRPVVAGLMCLCLMIAFLPVSKPT